MIGLLLNRPLLARKATIVAQKDRDICMIGFRIADGIDLFVEPTDSLGKWQHRYSKRYLSDVANLGIGFAWRYGNEDRIFFGVDGWSGIPFPASGNETYLVRIVPKLLFISLGSYQFHVAISHPSGFTIS